MKDSTSPPLVSPTKSGDLGFLYSKTGGFVVFALLFCVVFGYQIQSGAWLSDFGGHADEGAHVVTSLMVRDYLAGGFQEELHPVRFAESYYDKYPKVAIGHYPPGFYGVMGLALLFSRSPEAILLTMALSCAFCCWLTWRIGNCIFQAKSSALVAAFLLCLLPLIRVYTAIVMSDVLLVNFCLLALWAFAQYLSTSRLRYSLAFGFWAAFAILTKGSGLMLALVPPIAICLTAKWSYLRDWRLWIAALPVLVLSLPWLLLTRHITEEGMSHQPFSEYLIQAIGYYFSGCAEVMGWGAFILLIGFAVQTLIKRIRSSISPIESVLWAFMCGLFIFYGAVPSGFDHRYLIPVLPAAFILIILGIERITCDFWKQKRFSIVAVLIFGAIVLFETWRPVEKTYTGSNEAIAAAVADHDEGKTTVLVISNARGEGALISAAAFLNNDSVTVKRGSKILASSDWLGRGYAASFEDSLQFDEVLEDQKIDSIIIDNPDKNAAAHWKLALKLLTETNAAAPYQQVGEFRSKRKRAVENQFRVFKVTRFRSETEP